MRTNPVVGTNARLFINNGPRERPDWRPVPVTDWPAVACRKRPSKERSPRQQREQINRNRREVAAELAKPLPMAEQQRRAEANRAAHQARYPHPPKLDPLSQVRGDPRLRNEPAPNRPAVRDLTFADIVYAFDVSGEIAFRRAQRRIANAQRAAAIAA